MTYVRKDAVLICTGCPTPAQLNAKKARTVRIENGAIGVSTDKVIAQPGFPTCIAIPTAPRTCSPKLGEWARVKSDVLSKGKPQLLYPNTIPCAFGPGVVAMTYAGQVVTREYATDTNDKEAKCDWHGDEHDHKPFKKIFPKGGDTKRGKLGDWTQPNAMFSANKTSNKIRYFATWGFVTSKAEKYITQRHHVVPVQCLEELPDLANNLELLGYNNNTEANGIRMPMFDEDIFWHDLPRHRGFDNAHRAYNDLVTAQLKDKFKDEWKDFCREDKEVLLLLEIELYIEKVRNLIIRWSRFYFVYKNGGDRSTSFKNAGLPEPPKDKGRKFPLNFHD